MSIAMLRTFDRTRDVPKLIGCNTRNVPYRWGIYERHLSCVPAAGTVLDYGAGSLREAFEMAQRGFRVTAVDLDLPVLKSFAADYDWSGVRYRPELLDQVPTAGQFDLITAFDVIEHLQDPEAQAIAVFRSILAPTGLMFCTVPNRRTLPEIATRMALRAGKRVPSGEAHLQFKSPREWRMFFEKAGLDVVDHDMAIGCAVNTWFWSAQLPTNAVRKVARGMQLDFDPARIVNIIAPGWAMRGLDKLDRAVKPITRNLYGWNLFVLRAGPAVS
jgi:2-polyprenyl-3-methyl-5-hydroxy-6-metoxy-1,4-benzoquinol methylase